MEKDKDTPHALGRSGEEIALRFLKNKKYKIITKNYRLFRGEIDIIAQKRNILVFVEVKTRRSKNFGFPEESVTPSKQQQIKKIAQGFLVKNNLQDIECRFDVISLSFNDNEKFSIYHIKNAF
ncbi:MAG: YraN family protein [Candidatus Aminicenantes bacterium]|nr:YraN family protein [Candidatus Aminicenantes bacterium]